MLFETEEFIKWLWITSPNVSNIYRLLTIWKAFHINCLNNKCRAGNLPEVTWSVWILKEFWSQVRTFIARKMQFKCPSNIEWYLAQNITDSWFSYFLMYIFTIFLNKTIIFWNLKGFHLMSKWANPFFREKVLSINGVFIGIFKKKITIYNC